MPPKQPPVDGARHYRAPTSVKRTIAETLRRTEQGVHQSLYGPDAHRLKVIQFIRIALDAGHHAWARSYFAPIAELFGPDRAPAYELTIVRAAAQLEARENVCGDTALYTNHPDDLAAWAKALRAEAAADLNLADALDAEVARRKAGPA